MLKPLTILSVSTVALLASTSAFSHVLCAPDSPQGRAIGHTHNQAYTVPRIAQPAAHNPNQARYLQQQRARQQKALANQQRINQQRRAQALQKQQQIAAQKARQIQLQRLAAQRAQQARQQAALVQARQAKLQAQQAARYVAPAAPARKVVRYTAPVVQQQYVQPAYVEEIVYYQAPAPVVYETPVYYAPQPVTYTPLNSYVSVSVGSGGDHNGSFNNNRRQVSQPTKRVHSKHYSRDNGVVRDLQAKYQQARHNQAKRYNHGGSSHGNYKVGGNGGDRNHSSHGQAKRQQLANHVVWKGQNQNHSNGGRSGGHQGGNQHASYGADKK